MPAPVQIGGELTVPVTPIRAMNPPAAQKSVATVFDQVFAAAVAGVPVAAVTLRLPVTANRRGTPAPTTHLDHDGLDGLFVSSPDSRCP